MIETFKNAFKVKEVRNKILMTILFIFVYRLGCFIPIPGLDMSGIEFGTFNFLTVLNAITGSALSQGTLFAIGISPYINASIIMQLLTIAIPPLERLSKEGEEGKAKIDVITRFVTLGLAIVSAVGILFAFRSSGVLNVEMLGASLPLPMWVVFVYAAMVLVAGSMLCMWLGERITEFGISNGISIIIFVGILSTAGKSIMSNLNSTFTNGIGAPFWELLGFLGVVVVIFGFITWVDSAERKIKVQYAKQIKGNKMYGGQSTHIPIRVNGSGVLPLIFAFALISFPSLVISTFWPNSDFNTWWSMYMTSQGGHWIGTLVYTVSLAAFIFLFAYFYSQVQFNPIEISKNLQQNGGFIPGIRPGRETSEYLAKVVSRITLWGAVFLAILALVPSLIFGIVTSDSNLLNAFSATGMLIIVSVALEIEKSLENQILIRHYKGFLK